jgi:hypothetical protein
MTKPSPLCCLLLALCSGSVEAQDLAKPRATPLFSNVEQGPAFMVECVNTSTEPFRTMQVILGMAVRVDGVVHERRDRGVVGSLLGTDSSGQQARERIIFQRPGRRECGE